MHNLIIGFDIGSVSINTIICDNEGNIVDELPYYRHFGNTIDLCSNILHQIEKTYGIERINKVVFTGTHGKSIANHFKTFFEYETTAQVTAAFKLYPETKTIISIGGHDSALFLIEKQNNSFSIKDFKLNEACAAGTGSFIDQQAERIFSDLESLKLIQDPQSRIEAILSEFIKEGSKSDTPANVACRCTVFTKSDMIHLQNKGIPICHIIYGLHEGVARNYKSTLINNRVLTSPILFIGGYASNILAKTAFEKVLQTEVTVPKHHTTLGAYGAILNAINNNEGKKITSNEILNLKNSVAFEHPKTSQLKLLLSKFKDCGKATEIVSDKAYIGIDIGSTTTKLVLLSLNDEVIYKTYIPTEGQPIEALKKAIKNCIQSIDTSKISILGVGTTGSGREVAGLFIGADDIVNEVTAHAIGTIHFDPQIDTIFELGGQDAKYTKLTNGQISDFKMNKVCAAGTGSFLEETANKLGINIDKEYEDLALSSISPYKLTERCTVYMESDLMSYLQNGASVKDLLAGLSQAVVHNYLNRVVQEGKIGNRISFQGGPSLNKSVVAAFEQILGRQIITLPHREVMGAIGAALHAKETVKNIQKNKPDYKSLFKGWNIINDEFVHYEEICHRNPQCHNQCKLQIYKAANSEAVYGGECGMYESRQNSSKTVPNFSKIRNSIFEKYLPKSNTSKSYKLKIGIPRSLSFYQNGILWVNLFNKLGFETIVSPETNNDIANSGISKMTCESCFPVKISHGHAEYLKNKCDFLFLPLMIDMKSNQKNEANSYYCPYVEANPYMLKSALNLKATRIIKPAIYFSKGIESIKDAFMSEFIRLGIRINKDDFTKAWNESIQLKNKFQNELYNIGNIVLQKIGDEKAILVLGRPYSMYDSRTNLNLFSTFSRLGIYAIPQEFINSDSYNTDKIYPNMYWGFGKQILKASQIIKDKKNLFGLYLTSFSCGPDSFILHFFDNEMSKINKPFLELELDEHTAGAGIETRLLAFIDTIKNHKHINKANTSITKIEQNNNINENLMKRTIYIPYMAEAARCLAACFRHIGINAQVTPTYSYKALEYGKKHTSGKECYPCIITTGDMLDLIDKLSKKGIDVENEIAFFMPETEGPCRFGQYNRLQRIILDKYGYEKIPILSPSSEDSYSFNGLLSSNDVNTLRKLIWQSFVYCDIAEKALWHIRPYEINKGETDKVFEKVIQLGAIALENGGNIKIIKAAKKAASLFNSIKIKHEKKPLIGIVGEIFIRTHKQCNQQLVRELENMGCETTIASISEWISYTTNTSLEYAENNFKKNKSFKTISDITKAWIVSKYQNITSSLISMPFKDLLQGKLDHSTKEILNLVGETFSNHINGESILSLGGAYAYSHHNFNGIVNAMPFTCMPSTIASSILKTELRNKTPYIDMVYDGSIQPNRETNLATFVFQAKQNLNNQIKHNIK